MRRGRVKQIRRDVITQVQAERLAVVKTFLVATAHWRFWDRVKLCAKILSKHFAREVMEMTVYAVFDTRGALTRVERFAEKAQRFAAQGYKVIELVAQQTATGFRAENADGILVVESGVKTWTPKKSTDRKSVDKPKSDE